MRSYCKLTDAELAAGHPMQARQFADSSLPFLHEFKADSPSLLVLRDVGFCYESMGNLQQEAAMDRALGNAERRTAKANAYQWYLKSAAVWKEWNTRGAATPESESERRKVQRWLGGHSSIAQLQATEGKAMAPMNGEPIAEAPK